jgi:23S rRNA (pseudouridine1915-N3)-methyltransferase
MRISVYWFGRPARSPYEKQVEDFRKRTSRRWPAADIALKPATGIREADPAGALVREAEILVKKIPARWRLIVLDERGRQQTSPQFAHFLQKIEQKAPPGLAFVLGSDLGLAPSLRNRADDVISLSSMTLPHLLARLTLWEQLYRATDILGGGKYHRAG